MKIVFSLRKLKDTAQSFLLTEKFAATIQVAPKLLSFWGRGRRGIKVVER